MKWHGVSEVAKIVNLSRQSVYKRLKKLSLEEKINMGSNLFEEGQKVMLSDDGIAQLFGVTKAVTPDNQVDQPVVEKVVKFDTRVDNEVVSVMRNQLADKAQEVVRLDNMLTAVMNQLEEERKLRGEERQRTDTILMKLTNDISSLQKALEYRPQEILAPVAAPMPTVQAEPPAPIQATELEPSQRKVSFWESVKLGVDDCFGLLFGRG